jgi:hypothetical protein
MVCIGLRVLGKYYMLLLDLRAMMANRHHLPGCAVVAWNLHHFGYLQKPISVLYSWIWMAWLSIGALLCVFEHELSWSRECKKKKENMMRPFCACNDGIIIMLMIICLTLPSILLMKLADSPQASLASRLLTVELALALVLFTLSRSCWLWNEVQAWVHCLPSLLEHTDVAILTMRPSKQAHVSGIVLFLSSTRLLLYMIWFS